MLTAECRIFLISALKWLQWRNPLTSVFVYPFTSRRGGFSRPGLPRHLLALTRILVCFVSVSKRCRFSNEKTLFSPFRPGPVCYNVTMEEEILPCSRIYTYCDITGMPCTGACWEMKVLGFFGFFVRIEQKQSCKNVTWMSNNPNSHLGCLIYTIWHDYYYCLVKSSSFHGNKMSIVASMSVQQRESCVL